MALHLVEGYDDKQTVEVLGRTYPVPCLLEDDEGLRWFVAPGFFDIRAHTWARAAANGAAALAAPYGEQWVGVTVEYFMENRHDGNDGTYTLIGGLIETDEFPRYEQVLQTADLTRSPGGFVHLHTHSEYSALDGRSRISEIVEQVVADGQSAVSINDHGNCSGHPSLQKECDKAGIKPIFGIEAYFVNDRLRRPRHWYEGEDGWTCSVDDYQAMSAKAKKGLKITSDAAEVRKYYHLNLLAKNETGLHNLWAASTQSFRDGFYYYPRMDWDVLREHHEGMIATTGCLKGPVADALLDENEELARENLGRLLDIFGEDLFNLSLIHI